MMIGGNAGGEEDGVEDDDQEDGDGEDRDVMVTSKQNFHPGVRNKTVLYQFPSPYGHGLLASSVNLNFWNNFN